MMREGRPFPRKSHRRRALTVALHLGATGAVALGHGSAFAQAAAPTDTPPPDKAPETRVLTLAAAERAALEEQPQLRVARAQTAVAIAASEQLRAPLLPQVTGLATYGHEWGSFRSIGGAGVPQSGTTVSPGTVQPTGTPSSNSLSNSFDTYSFGVTATQLIWDFGQTSEKYVAARSTVAAQRYEEQVTRLTIVSAVRQAYFTARQNKELVDVAQDTLNNQQKHLVQVQAFVQVGTQPEIALAQQKAAVANAKVQLINSQNAYNTAKAQLNQAAGLVGGTAYDVTDEQEPPIEDEEQPLEALVEKAFAARPELANLWKQEDAQKATIRAAKGGYGPALTASGGISESAVLPNAPSPNANVGVTLTWLLFQGGLTRATVRAAEANLDSITSTRDLTRLEIELSVNTAQLNVRAAKATIGAADEAVTSAREQLRLAEQRYATGVGNIIELDDAQVSYTSAAAQVVQARYNLASARAQLLAALGRT
jgi:outer membrane protein